MCVANFRPAVVSALNEVTLTLLVTNLLSPLPLQVVFGFRIQSEVSGFWSRAEGFGFLFFFFWGGLLFPSDSQGFGF